MATVSRNVDIGELLDAIRSLEQTIKGVDTVAGGKKTLPAKSGISGIAAKQPTDNVESTFERLAVGEGLRVRRAQFGLLTARYVE